MKEIAEKSLFEIPGGWKSLLWLLVLIGAGMFIAGLVTGGDESVLRTWQAFLINTVFWGGIAHAGVLFAVIWQLTDAKWGRAFKRLAEACAGFLPVSFLMFMIVFLVVMFCMNGPILPFCIMAKQSRKVGSTFLSSSVAIFSGFC